MGNVVVHYFIALEKWEMRLFIIAELQESHVITALGNRQTTFIENKHDKLQNCINYGVTYHITWKVLCFFPTGEVEIAVIHYLWIFMLFIIYVSYISQLTEKYKSISEQASWLRIFFYSDRKTNYINEDLSSIILSLSPWLLCFI